MDREIIVAENLEHLKTLVRKEIFLYGSNCSLNHIDVSQVTDMRSLFNSSNFNGDVSRWDTSCVEDMSFMFMDSSFNGDVSAWNTSHVKDMNQMFTSSFFDRDISHWDVSNVKDMSSMFFDSKFSGNLELWTPYSLEKMYYFHSPKMQKPYWTNYDKNLDRKIAIEHYIEKKNLIKRLNNELITQESIHKKIKV